MNTWMTIAIGATLGIITRVIILVVTGLPMDQPIWNLFIGG